MEGKGEGMVAIVEGLRDAGLAVTLMGRRGRERPRLTGVKHSGQLALVRSSVETSTNGLPLVASVDTPAQICDDRYTSSYQVAHCRARPSSPPVETAEFPPQRAEPCRTLGNFEIGVVGSGEASPIRVTRSPRSLRDSYTSVDRGLISNGITSRCTEAFVHSLRKYPSLPPNRSISSDLVQRLLAYTQAKNFSKSSYHIASRSSRNKTNDPPKDSTSNDILSKSVQTYTRAKKGTANVAAGERDKDGRCADKGRVVRSPKRVRSRSPPNELSDIRRNISIIDASYDYLKASRRAASRAADVRYLTDVTRCLRDTLRQICDDAPVVCPNIQNRYSRHRKEHHRRGIGVESSSDTNNVDAQVSAPMVSSGVPVMSSCEAISGTYQQTCPNRPRICCYCRKAMPCACKASMAQISKFPFSKESLESKSTTRFSREISLESADEFPKKLEEAVMNWLQEIPVYANENAEDKTTRMKMARELIDKLKGLKGDADFKEKANAEIAECVNNMPMWYPGNKSDQDMFKRQIVGNLAGKLAGVAKDSERDKRSDKQSSIDLGDEFQKHKRSSINLGDEFQKHIWQWLQDIPEFRNASTGSLSKNQKLVESFAKKLQKIQAQSTDDTQTQEEMQNAINEWLEDNAGKMGRLDPRTKNKLVEKLLGKLVETAKQATKKRRDSGEEIVVLEILDWLNDIPELSGGNKVENQKMVENLAKKLNELRSQGKDDSELEDEILNWLTTSCESKGERLDSKTKRALISKLLGKINKLPVVKTKENLILDILGCLEDIPDFDTSSTENKKLVEQLAKKIKEFQSQAGGGADQDEIKDEIVNWISDLVKSSGVKLSPTAKNQLTKQLLNIAAAAPKQRKRWNKMEDPQKIMNSLKEEVGHILDKSKVDFDDRDDVESVLSNILADQVMRGENEEQTKERLISALEDLDISHDQSESIANKLSEMAKEMSLMYKTQDSTLLSDKRMSVLSPMQKEMFQEIAQREIVEFIEEMSGDTSVASKKKFRMAAQELADKVGDIMTDQNSTPEEKRENIENEISKYLQDLSIETDVPIEEQASQLADRLQNLAFKTSTPKRSSLDKEISFRPRRDSRGLTISGFDDVSQMMQTQAPSKEEKQYMGELVTIIDDWMSNLPIDLNSDESKGFKDVMIKDLAGDIIDRQKYLQLNPDAKTSDEEELEHLKYQVFRWLNKLPDVKNLMPSISKTDDLMDRIKGVPVPQLIKPSERRSSKTRESSVQHLSKDLASLQNEILKWFEAVPVKYLASKNKKQQREMVKDLAEQLDQFRKDGTLTEPVFQEIVSDWLDKNLKGASEKYISSLTEGLKGVLVNKDLMDLKPKSDMRRLSISADGIKDAIMKWSQKLPFQSGKSIDHAIHEVERLTTQIKGTLKNAQHDNLELESIKKDLEKDIKSFLNKVPVLKNKIKDDHIQELTEEISKLVKVAKPQLQSMTTDSTTSKPGFKKTADVLYDNIEDWCENLPIQEGNTPEEKEKVKTLKQNIASKLINIIGDLNMNPDLFNDDSLYEDVLNDEIDNLLSTLPPSPELENNLPALKENLIAKVKEAKAKTQDELAGQAYKQQLRDAISKTLPSIDNLSAEEQAPFEILKDELADAYIELHYAADNDEVKAKLKNKISEEINQFCNDYLKRYPSSPVDPRKLNRELFNVLQKVPMPKDESIKSQVEQVRIKDEINEWLKDVPLKEDLTPAEQLQKNKIVTLLAKRLHDIEKEKELDPEIDIEEEMQKEIKKWIMKLPIKPEDKENVEQMVEQLTDKLKDTEKSRRFSISRIRHSVDDTEEDKTCSSTCPMYSKLEKPKPALSCRKFLSQYAPPFPGSTLSVEDRAHLQRIRERNDQRAPCFKPSFPPCCCKDASVSPIPIDESSQTDIGNNQWQRESNRSMQRAMPCPAMSQQSEYIPCSQTNQPVSPQVIVKEYYWDSPDATMRDQSCIPCTPEPQSYQSQTQPCIPPEYESWPQSQMNIQSGRFLNPEESVCPGMDMTQPPLPPCMTSPPPQRPPPCIPPPCMQPQQFAKPPPPCVQPPLPPCMSKPNTTQPFIPQSPYPQEPSLPPCITTRQSPQSMTSQRSPYQVPQPRPCMAQPPCVPQSPPPCMTELPYSTQPPHLSSGQSMQRAPCFPPPRSPCPEICKPQPPPCMPSRQSSSNQPRPPCVIGPPCSTPQPPCMSSGQSVQKPPCFTQPTNQPSRPCMMEPPCTPQPPCMSSGQSVQKPPCFRQPPPPNPPCQRSPPCQERGRRKDRPCFGSPDISSTSSPFDTECPDAGTSRSFGPRVTRLGSLDDVPCSKTCGSQSPRAKRSRGSPNEDFDWTIRFPEDTEFWGTPCPRRRPHRSPQKDGSFIKERERKEEKMRCRCCERVLTKCVGRRPPTCCSEDPLKHCSKCCGVHCPHPSYLFFR